MAEGLIELELFAVRQHRDNPEQYAVFLREIAATPRMVLIDVTRFDAERIAGVQHGAAGRPDVDRLRRSRIRRSDHSRSRM
jgi:hypothetical protein